MAFGNRDNGSGGGLPPLTGRFNFYTVQRADSPTLGSFQPTQFINVTFDQILEDVRSTAAGGKRQRVATVLRAAGLVCVKFH